jgi:hypothetical protein
MVDADGNVAQMDQKHKNASTGLDVAAKAGEVRDKNGRILPARDFPDMKALTDYIHRFGLKAGISIFGGREN